MILSKINKSFLLFNLCLFVILLSFCFYCGKTNNFVFSSLLNHPHIFTKSDYDNKTHRSTNNCITFLVASPVGDTRHQFDPYPRLIKKIRLLDEKFQDNHTSDLIIFHTGYPFRKNILEIISTTKRQVYFVNIDDVFYRFSPGFDPYMTDPTWSQRGKFNYHHMCYFWFKQVFEQPILRHYRYMMRLDDDSTLVNIWPNIFDILIERQALYIANQREVDFDYVLPGITRVRNTTIDFIQQHAIQVQNPTLFADLFAKPMEVPNFWNNFELLDLSLMKRNDVQLFIDAIDRSKGIFLYRWGDAPLRYITLALFAKPSEILHRTQLKLEYCHPC